MIILLNTYKTYNREIYSLVNLMMNNNFYRNYNSNIINNLTKIAYLYIIVNIIIFKISLKIIYKNNNKIFSI